MRSIIAGELSDITSDFNGDISGQGDQRFWLQFELRDLLPGEKREEEKREREKEKGFQLASDFFLLRNILG